MFLKKNCVCNRLLWAIYFCVFPSALAQKAPRGEIQGQVRMSAGGASIPKARIEVWNHYLSLVRHVVSDEAGNFTAAGLPATSGYEVEVAASGFHRRLFRNLTVSSGQALRINCLLVLEKVKTSVTVHARADTVGALAGTRQELRGREIQALPSNGRNVERLALLDPHVRNTTGLGSDGPTAMRLSIDANSFRYTYFQLDGSTNYDFGFDNAPQQRTPLGAVKEFQVMIAPLSAAEGGSTTGIINVVTKSGTDQFHGEAFGLVQPSGLQAVPVAATLHVPNQLEQFGGSAGGPLVRGRDYFFASYEQRQSARGAFIQSPSPQTYIGNERDQLALVRFDEDSTNHRRISLVINGNHEYNDNPNDVVGGYAQPSAASLLTDQASGLHLTTTSAWRSNLVNSARITYINSIPWNGKPLSPQVSILRLGYSTEGGSSFTQMRERTWEVSDSLEWERSRHQLLFGANWIRSDVNDASSKPFGAYQFAAGPPFAGQEPLQYTQTFGSANLNRLQNEGALFVQDNFKISNHLAGSLGLRYEIESITQDRNNFAPRAGIRWDVEGNGKTIIHAGGGIFYDQYFGYIDRYFRLNGLNSPTQTYTIPYGAPGFPVFPQSLAAPPSGLAIARRNLYLPPAKMLNPYSLQFPLGVERKLRGGWVLSAGALLTHTLKQMRLWDGNAPAPFFRTKPGEIRSVAAADATRPLSEIDGTPIREMLVVENSGSSIYNSLDLALTKQAGRRFFFSTRYVYSSSSTYSTFYGEANTGIPNDWGAPDRAERGPSDYFQRNRSVTRAIIRLPWSAQISVAGTLASGLPVNPLTGIDNNGDTNLSDRPPGMGRNSFRGPMEEDVDFAVWRRFRLWNAGELECRLEGFNVLNHANLISVNNIYGSGARPLSTFLSPIAGVRNSDPPRQLQFELRLLF